MSLGTSIRQCRKSLKVTLQALAAQVNADAGNLSRIERGELGVTESLLRKIAVVLNTTPASLYAQSDATALPNFANSQINQASKQ